MWDSIKKFFKANEPEKKDNSSLSKESTSKVKTPRKKVELTAKEKATAAGEPYISVIKVDLDPSDINNGAFELDWNDKFIINLIKSGYKQREDDTDQIIVDRWFQNVCRNVALEIYEQQQADPTNRDLRMVRSRDIGDGRTEIS